MVNGERLVSCRHSPLTGTVCAPVQEASGAARSLPRQPPERRLVPTVRFDPLA